MNEYVYGLASLAHIQHDDDPLVPLILCTNHNDNNKILKEKSSVPIIKKNEISFLPSTDNTDNINSARP